MEIEHLGRSTDKEQKELLARLWRDYGKAIVFALVVGLGVGYGYRYYQQYQQKQAVAASEQFDVLLSTAPSGQAEVAKTIQSKYGSSAYASMAAMIMAANDVRQTNYPAAMKQLDWVIHANNQAVLVALAKVRKARILIQQKDYVKAISLAQSVTGSMRSMALMVAGDAYAARGQSAQAKTLYGQAQALAAQQNITNPLLNLKISA